MGSGDPEMSHSCLVFQSCQRTILSLSLNLSLPLSFFDRRESFFCCVLWFFKKARKREKKNREGQKTVFKNKTTKKARVFNNNNNNRKISPQNFSSPSSCEKERKMHFQVVNCPSQVYTITTIFLSFSLCSFFVLLSLSSAFCVRRLVFVFVFVRELNRKRNWKRCRSRSRTFSL